MMALWTAHEGNLRIMKELFDKTEGRCMDSMIWKTSMLQIACSRGHNRMVKWMLDQPIGMKYLNTPSCREQITCVDRAAKTGEIGVLKMVIEAKGNVNAKRTNGQTPVHAATMCGSVPALEVLKQAGADPHCKDVKGRSARDWANHWNFSEQASFLEQWEKEVSPM